MFISHLPNIPSVVYEEQTPLGAKYMTVHVGSYSDFFLMHVVAVWIFNANSELIEIIVHKSF
jgi:hypothetical protein